eukprot:scaffold79236_cov32-Tisochrysis_lutea.AAC.9
MHVPSAAAPSAQEWAFFTCTSTMSGALPETAETTPRHCSPCESVMLSVWPNMSDRTDGAEGEGGGGGGGGEGGESVPRAST